MVPGFCQTRRIRPFQQTPYLASPYLLHVTLIINMVLNMLFSIVFFCDTIRQLAVRCSDWVCDWVGD
jgi:hypothetical protein